MPGLSISNEQVLELLGESPARIATLCSGLTPSQLRTSPADDTWSAIDVLAHLRACADVWGNCIVTMLAEDAPTLRAINPRSWIKRTNYRELELQPSMRSFVTQRAELLAVLEPLTPADWSRTATMTGAGSPLVRSVSSYAQRLARHERTHVKQFKAIVDAVRT